MEEVKIRARAKINIALDVLGSRNDGYHEVSMIMQQVDLYDEVIVKKTDMGLRLKTDCEYIPNDEGNIAHKAASLMMELYGIKQGVDIQIHKNIPVAAGLAGGSTDAAAVLIAMNRLWKLGLSKDELMKLSLPLGADVPFCLLGGAALAEGIGEKLTPIRSLENSWVVLSKPNLCVSTAEVYKNLDLENIIRHPEMKILLDAMKKNDIITVTQNLCNVLETVTEKMHPIIRDVKRKMLEYNALGSLMSGSGPTVFGLFKDYHKAKNAYENLSKVYKQTYVVKTYKGDDFNDH
mgnify:CR=1 FL=1